MALAGGRVEMATFNFIYSFHMPLFVFISGYFTRPGEISAKSFRSAFHFLSLFIIFDLLMWAVNSRDLGVRSALTPQYAMWYLLSMFYWRLGAMFIRKEWLTVRNFIAVTLFSALIGFVPFIGEVFSFNRTFCFLCFFVAGMMCRDTDFFKRMERIPLWWLLLPSACIFIFMLWLYGGGLRYVYSFSYGGNPLRFLERAGQMGFAVVLGLCFIRVSRMKMPSIFARLGRKSLFFYLYHTFLIMALPYVVRSLGLPNNLVMSVIYTIIIVIILSFLSRIRFLNAFLDFNLFDGFASRLFQRCRRLGTFKE